MAFSCYGWNCVFDVFSIWEKSLITHVDAYVLILDLGAGDVASRIKDNKPDAATAKLILAEIVTAVEKIHSANVSHEDLQLKNILIGSDGHLMLTDFGLSETLTDNDASKTDWFFVWLLCNDIFPKQIRNKNFRSFTNLLLEMTDDRLPGKLTLFFLSESLEIKIVFFVELKNHPYFSGMDWDKVAARKSTPPFQAYEIQVNEKNPQNIVELLKIDVNDDELDENLTERFRSKLQKMKMNEYSYRV